MEMGLIFLVKILKKNFWDFGPEKIFDERHQAITLTLHIGHGGRLVTGEGRGAVLKVVLLFDYQTLLFSFVKININQL